MKEGMVYDLFISYAHLDNQPVSEGQKGWISAFHKSLEVRLGQLLGRQPMIWRDDKLQGNDRFGEEIVSKIMNAKTFMTVISPGYQESRWCLKELVEFVKAAGKGQETDIGSKSRIFKVVKTFVPHEEHPAEILGLLGYDFFIKNDSGRPREFHPEKNLPYYQNFLEKLEDVALDISNAIKEFEKENVYIERLSEAMNFDTYINRLITDFENSELHHLYIEPDFSSKRKQVAINSFQFIDEWIQQPARENPAKR